MKKILFTLGIALPFLFNSCSDDENKENDSIKLESSKLEILVGNEMQINATSSLDISYSSENDYYASVSRSGLVTANKVGETSVLLNNGVKKETVDIAITPKYTTYPDPYLNFNASKNDIIKEVGNPDRTTDDGGLVYDNYSSKASAGLYMFDGSKYTGFGVTVNTSYAAELGNFIRERYNLYWNDEDNYTIYYINATTISKATVIVAVEITLSGIYVIYMPASALSKSLPDKSIIENFYLKLNEL